ncbi:hypothetical protein EDD27_2528 [Nonomuraea polychroma]|uniref:Uncharacterized protein n=1 Tax=Nonomuraea polychroma TaxID=46176 RepID=A0A438M2Y8_9ACTN|nr:hypothetical protein EDD27_2528 [Nonomuraea polychroma]
MPYAYAMPGSPVRAFTHRRMGHVIHELSQGGPGRVWCPQPKTGRLVPAGEFEQASHVWGG